MIYNLKQKLLVFSVIFGITSLFAQSPEVTFTGVFGGTVVTDDGAYTMPSGSEPWAGFANEDVSLYPFILERVDQLHLLVQQMVLQRMFISDLKRIHTLTLSQVFLLQQ